MIRRTPALFKPYPELVEPLFGATPYEIVDTNGKKLPTNGMTSLEKRILMVPFDEEHYSVAIHELGHVRWSPARQPKVTFDRRFLLAVEDARINMGLALFRLPVLLRERERAEVGALARLDLEHKDALTFLLRAVAALGTNAEDPIWAALTGAHGKLAETAVARLARVRKALEHGRAIRNSEVASFALVVRLAKELADELSSEVKSLGYKDVLPPMIELDGEACCFSDAHDHGARTRRGMRDPRERSDCASGALRVATPVLPHDSPRARGGRRGGQRAAQEGSLMRYPHRFDLDMAIFRRTQRVVGGTVLIDTSGSMALDAAGIDKILLASTAATLIAIYSGQNDHGELRVIAKGDKRADPKDLVPYGKGNVIDEPALAWLARQSEPRIWISDGGVTGIGDSPSHGLTARCQEIVQRARILRVKTIQEAAATLARWRPNARASAPAPETPAKPARSAG
jgi:hypothetical protein